MARRRRPSDVGTGRAHARARHESYDAGPRSLAIALRRRRQRRDGKRLASAQCAPAVTAALRAAPPPPPRGDPPPDAELAFKGEVWDHTVCEKYVLRRGATPTVAAAADLVATAAPFVPLGLRAAAIAAALRMTWAMSPAPGVWLQDVEYELDHEGGKWVPLESPQVRRLPSSVEQPDEAPVTVEPEADAPAPDAVPPNGLPNVQVEHVVEAKVPQEDPQTRRLAASVERDGSRSSRSRMLATPMMRSGPIMLPVPMLQAAPGMRAVEVIPTAPAVKAQPEARIATRDCMIPWTS